MPTVFGPAAGPCNLPDGKEQFRYGNDTTAVAASVLTDAKALAGDASSPVTTRTASRSLNYGLRVPVQIPSRLPKTKPRNGRSRSCPVLLAPSCGSCIFFPAFAKKVHDTLDQQKMRTPRKFEHAEFMLRFQRTKTTDIEVLR
ncbi:MAG TPA: hypothetical protein VNJ52_03645 [Patescibacteria group bacterium]|nr:hypothetical protein [Patescibacteria group bacterium]